MVFFARRQNIEMDPAAMPNPDIPMTRQIGADDALCGNGIPTRHPQGFPKMAFIGDLRAPNISNPGTCKVRPRPGLPPRQPLGIVVFSRRPAYPIRDSSLPMPDTAVH